MGCRGALLLVAQNATASRDLSFAEHHMALLASDLCTLLIEMLLLSAQNNSEFRTKLHTEAGSKGTRHPL